VPGFFFVLREWRGRRRSGLATIIVVSAVGEPHAGERGDEERVGRVSGRAGRTRACAVEDAVGAAVAGSSSRAAVIAIRYRIIGAIVIDIIDVIDIIVALREAIMVIVVLDAGEALDG